nr:hypothetical protein [Streptomyces sp. DSM 41633]
MHPTGAAVARCRSVPRELQQFHPAESARAVADQADLQGFTGLAGLTRRRARTTGFGRQGHA